MKIKTLFLVALLSGCSSLPKPLDNDIRTYNLIEDATAPIGTFYLHRNTTSDMNCIIIVTLDSSTIANMLQVTTLGFKLNYGEYVVGASFRGDFCGTKDALATITIDSEQPYNLDATIMGDELRLLTRPIDQK